MGAWGVLPDENDASRDMLEERILLPLEVMLYAITHEQADDHNDVWARVGVVYSVTEMGVFVPTDVLGVASTMLTWLETQQEWIDSWDDPAAIRRSISETRELFDAMIQKEEQPVLHNARHVSRRSRTAARADDDDRQFYLDGTPIDLEDLLLRADENEDEYFADMLTAQERAKIAEMQVGDTWSIHLGPSGGRWDIEVKR